MTSQRSAIFAEPVRTAIGTFGGSLKDIPATGLGAAVVGAAVARAGLLPGESGSIHRLAKRKSDCGIRNSRCKSNYLWARVDADPEPSEKRFNC